MTRWEYRHEFRTETSPVETEVAHLNEMGAAGWELVAVAAVGAGQAALFFKREVERLEGGDMTADMVPKWDPPPGATYTVRKG